MLLSTPTKIYMHKNTPCDTSMSPKYHHHRRHCTPPSAAAQPYDSPMLTPSPLRQRPLYPTTMQYDDADDSLQSPYKTPALAQIYNPFYATKPQTIPADDEEGHIFLSSAASPTFTPFFATSSSQPLLTPVKQARRTTPRSVLSPQTNTLFGLAVPQEEDKPATRVGVGTKRKSTPHATPRRPHNLTPLKLTQSEEGDSTFSFDRLAPLSAPKFNARTPQTKAETEAYLKRQTATLTRLRLSDQDALDFDGAAANDSRCEIDEDDSLFLNKPRLSGQPIKSLAFHTSKGKEKEEVAEAISPGGHITKRRARSRPVSAELLEQTFGSPKRSPVKPSKPPGIPTRAGSARPRHSGPVAFPSTAHRGRASPASVSSSSEAGSPRPRRRISGSLTATRPHPLPFRPPLSRIDSVSSATLFFGPAISAAPKTADSTTSSNGRSRTDTNLSASTPAPASRQLSSRPIPANRHSYAGPGSSGNDLNLWRTFQARDVSPSPGSSPFSRHARNRSTDLEDEDMFFAGEDTSFRLNVTKHSPSPAKAALPMKHKLQDSLALSDEDEVPSTGSSLGIGGEFLNAMPKASTSVTSITSDEGLVTPGVGPDGFSGWPTASVYINQQETHPYGGEGIDVDEFIMKTLAAASKGSNMPKKAPGTPVKKARMSYFGNERPWQSAVASKVGLRDDCEFKQMPRKSLPAAFPPMGAKGAKLSDYQPTDTEDEEEYSPSTRRCDNRYTGLGLGQPTQAKNGVPTSFSRWLVRRSSSGAFSSGSDSASLSNTPTRAKGIDWQLPKPRIPLRLSPSSDALDSKRSTSGSSSGSSVTLNSPTTSRAARGRLVASGAGAANARVPRLSHPLLAPRRFSDTFTEEQQPGRFERDFDELEEVGSGEFGKVIKVQRKNGDDGEVYAIKKSKRFEGAKHRLRLREEVDILKHLSQAALSTSCPDGRHPNVLAYIDSWEEDEELFIQTELCESGNLARFLWEYGRVFPRLDEARVWKIVADLSNGLRFIHDSGVIHLDLKPSNVFVTKEGRFKIGDFGMASLWPRRRSTVVDGTGTASGVECGASVAGGSGETGAGGFEREGDKLYLAPEVLQGRYGKAADVFSFGMTILETATNIVVPDQGEAWHRLRNEDFSQVDLEYHSEALVDLLRQMMRTDPAKRLTMTEVCEHPVVSRARIEMERTRQALSAAGVSTWGASPLASVPEGFLEEILGEDTQMDTSP